MAKKKLPDVDWVFANTANQTYECRRCGVRESMQIPARLEAFIMRGEAFLIDHANCKPVEAKGGQS